ncbi:MAG: polyamine aminopropyltransferase [SAR86 cluster bacterium]|jgi:spermidine synthase|tara:strand:- start:19396 stop:21063 length:1668 start_codon:yes stop_codon:yes gene_type:complete
MKTARLLPVLLAFCMFSTGASGLVSEYLLATITTYILGNSIEQFSLVIASMMLMMGVSGFVQSKMTDRNLLQKFITVEVLMALLGGFAPLAIYASYGYLEHYFTIIHYGFVLSIGFLIGFEIPLVMRIIEKQNIPLKTNLTIVYAMDYVGAFVGALIWVNYLLKNFPLSEISFIVAGFNFIVAAITILYFLYVKVIDRPAMQILALLLTAAALTFGWANNRDFSALLEQKFYDDPIVYKKTTRYQHLVMTHNSNIDDTRLYINGNTQFSSLDEGRYHDFLVHPVMAVAPSIKHVLVLGGGDGLALREIIKYAAVESVTLVDLDPEMIDIATNNQLLASLNNHAFQHAKVNVASINTYVAGSKQAIYMREAGHKTTEGEWVASVDVFNIDADQFLKKQPAQKWDAVVIDLPDPSSIELSKLYSKQFYQSLRRYLTAEAYVAIQSTSPYHAKEAYLSIGETLKAAGFKVLPYRQNIPSFGDWGYYLAWIDARSSEVVKLQLSSLAEFKVDTGFITPELLAASFAFGKGELVADNPCVNTLMQPCLLTNYLDRSWLLE